MDNSNPANRLKAARLQLGMTQKDFGGRMGTTGASVQRWETGGAEISEVVCRAVEQAFTIRYEWLLAGEGPMWVTGPKAYPSHPGVEFRPLIEGAATCGPGGEISDPGPTALRFPFRTEFLQELVQGSGAGGTEDLYVVECAGESMRPTIHPGDLAIISTALELRIRPKRSALYLVRPELASTDGRIKRVRVEGDQLWFSSDAPGFAPVSVDVDSIAIQSLILGRVCWISRSVLKDERIDLNW